MNKPPQVRLHLYLASHADRGVILRQGPSRQFCMIGWDTKTDTFEVGQWVKNKIYTDVCDISPDGRHFLYFILDGRWDSPAKGTYTAISRVPYFTALALYPQGDTWGGGGFFIDHERYFVRTADETSDIVGLAGDLRRELGQSEASLCKSLWRRINHHEPFPDRSGRFERAHTEIDALIARKNLYHAEGPLLYRKTNEEKMDMIGDFSDMHFKPVLAPYEGGVKE